MSFKKLILSAMISSLFAGLAHANISVSYPVSFNPSEDVCSHLSGRWNGEGDISADLVFSTMHCHYIGTVDVSPSNDKFNLHVAVSSHSPWPCPGSETLDLPATCKNGNVVIKSNKANLHGQMNQPGNAADLTGTINFTVSGNDVTADVDRLHLQR